MQRVQALHMLYLIYILSGWVTYGE